MSDQQDMPVREVNRTANSMPALTGLPLALYSLKPDYSPGWYEQEPKWEAFPMNELEKVTEELEQHVRRLVPGFLKGNEAVLKKKEFKDRLSARWKSTLHGLRSGANKQDQDWVPRPLPDVLSDRQHKERTRTYSQVIGGWKFQAPKKRVIEHSVVSDISLQTK